MTDAERTAERIITTEGLTFALAIKCGTESDMKLSRLYLKEAIMKALNECRGKARSA